MVRSAAFARRSSARVALLVASLLLGVTVVGAADANAHDVRGGYYAPGYYYAPPPPYYVRPYGPGYATPYYAMPYYAGPPAPYGGSILQFRFGGGDRRGDRGGRRDGDRGHGRGRD